MQPERPQQSEDAFADRPESGAINDLYRPFVSSIFLQASSAETGGGSSHYGISRNTTDLAFNFNEMGFDKKATSFPVHEDPREVQLPIQGFRNRPLQSWRQPSSWGIYYRQMILKKRGYPLWILAPNPQLPLQYRREGISIGDVGILTDGGGFDYLFNVCLPRAHPNNPDNLPDDFTPLSLTLAPHILDSSSFGTNSYLASSSVDKFRSDDSGLSLIFKTSAKEGAVLTMPLGSKSEDLKLLKQVRKYIADNIELWYRYAYDILGLPVQNSDLRLVVGWDQGSTWGMAAFAKTMSQTSNAFRLNFRPNKSGADTAGIRQMGYSWEFESGMAAEGRTGPDHREIEALRAGDPEEEGKIYENQCFFVRSANTTMAPNAWNKVISETGMVFPVTELTNIHHSPSFQSSSHSTTNSQPGPSSMGNSYRSQLGHTNLNTSDESSWYNTSNLSLSSTIHPSKIINERLLKDHASARMVITQDQDWMSVLRNDDVIMPSGEELYNRILEAYDIVVEEGVISLEPRKPGQAAAASTQIQNRVSRSHSMASEGFSIHTITPGDGARFPQRGDKVTMHYVGMLANGNVFDSSRDRGRPFKTEIGVGKVIRGWDEGVLQLSVGQKVMLTVSPEYAHGTRGLPPAIPPNETLRFEIELLEIESFLYDCFYS